MTQRPPRASCVWLAAFVLIALAVPSAAGRSLRGENHSDDDRGDDNRSLIFFLAPPALSPAVFDPASQTSSAKLRVGVTPFAGLEADEAHERREKARGHGDDRFTFVVQGQLTVSSGSHAIANVASSVKLQAPFTFVQVPKPHGRGTRRVILAVLTLSWTGDLKTGGCIPDGTFVTSIRAALARVKTTRRGPDTVILARTPAVTGSVTTRGTPPTLTLTSSVGAFTNQSTAGVSGMALGQAPLALTINGAAVAISPSGTFSTTVALPQGSSTIVGVATDCSGRKSTQLLTVFRDDVAPVASFTSPAPGFTNQNRPTIRLAYSDGAPSSGINLASLVVLQNNVNISASFTAGPTSATFTPESPLPDGQVTLTGTIRDNASNVSNPAATLNFTVDTSPPLLSLFPK